MYDLLFRVEPDTLVMIDEPELSLHVIWQKAFIADLLAIVQTVGFDVLLATHSPFIAGERNDLMIALPSTEDASQVSEVV
jgi:predicted ATPase